jgi:hypothetical protein
MPAPKRFIRRAVVYSDHALKKIESQKRDREIMERLYDILTVDINDIIQHRRCNCRYCHGENHEYQRKDWEMERDLNQYIARGKNPEIFKKMGGSGFDELADPHPTCPTCFGHGIPRTYVKDTRKLSRRIRNAIAGIKHTKNGAEIQLHDWMKAFDLYAKVRGLIVERKQISVLDLAQMPEEQLDTLLEQSAPLIDNDDPDLQPFVKMLEDQRDRPTVIKPKPRRAVLYDDI